MYMNAQNLITKKESNNANVLLYAVPDDICTKLFMNRIDLKPYCGKDIVVNSDMEKVVFYRTYENGQRQAIQFKIPTFEKEHPAKMEATKYSFRIVYEYTMRKEYTTTEIDWYGFKSKFLECFETLLRHSI